MNTNQTPDTEDTLRPLLRSWAVTTPLPVGFSDQVWKRITRAERQAQPAFWSSLREWFDTVLPRPKYAFSYLTMLLVLGIGFGSWAAHQTKHRMDSTLSMRYVQSVAPYQADLSEP